MRIRQGRFTGVAALALAMLCGAAPVLAQTASAAPRAQATNADGREVRASRLIGTGVRDSQGQSLGKIEDLIIDVAGQRVQYAVLSFNGFLDTGDKLFAYPLRAFRPGAGDHLVLNVSQEKLRRAPGFARGQEAWTDGRYPYEVERYFGAGAVELEAIPPGERMRSANRLIGRDVADRRGADAGEIADLVVNLRTGAVPYAVLAFDRAWSLDEKLLPLPMQAFIYPPQADAELVLDLPRERLQMRRGFAGDRWPDLNDPAYRRDMRAYLSTFGAGAAASQGGGGAGAAGN